MENLSEREAESASPSPRHLDRSGLVYAVGFNAVRRYFLSRFGVGSAAMIPGHSRPVRFGLVGLIAGPC